MGTITVGLLGELDPRVDARPVRIGGHRQRTVLAMLCAVPGRVVSVDALIDAVWAGRPPATARTQVAICVVGLRKAFARQGVTDREVIGTVAPGYRFCPADGDEVDVTRFADRIAEADDLADRGETAAAVDRLADALALWRGPALSGLPATALELEAERLEELRLVALEQWAELCLRLGRHKRVMNELHGVVARHPLRETARAHLMRAQYGAGLRSDALATYRAGRRISVAEVGLELGPLPRSVHEAILRDDPALVAPEEPALVASVGRVPAELPPQSAELRGRQDELAVLDRMGRDPAGDGPVVVYLSGAAGIGKTALAVHWAHRIADAYPDGQIYVDLGAEGTDPVGSCLHSLGVATADVPPDRDGRRNLYRSLLARRRVLLVLDGVSGTEQATELLPGSGGSAAILTSREVHVGLLAGPCRSHLPLGPLDERAAIDLLGDVAGRDRIAADPSAARRLADRCELIPLALRIAGARLAARRHWTVEDMLRRTEDETRRLDELTTSDHDMRASLAETCSSLTEVESRLLNRLGSADGDQVSSATCARLLGIDVDDARDAMERLADRALVRPVGGGRTGDVSYRISGLAHGYVRELEAGSRTGD